MPATPLTEEQEALLVKHLPFVLHIAAKVASKLPPSIDIEDLECDGRIGLLQAVQGFDPDVGGSFLAYSKKRIRGAMLDGIRDLDWIGRTYRAKGTDLPSMRPFSSVENREIGHTVEKVDGSIDVARHAISADLVKWFLDRLGDREAKIVWSYLGPEGMTFAEIGYELHISEGRVAHVYHKAIGKIHYLAEKLETPPLQK